MSHEILIIAIASLCGLFLTWGVGANDLSNVLSPSIGAKAINLRQAVIIALIFELSGVLFGGEKVAVTVQSGIIDSALLSNTPLILINGMLAALLASSIWIALASRFGIPVSLTNSIVGSLVGFGALALGWHTVHWKVVGWIGLSWIICPCVAALLAYNIFRITRQIILGASHPIKKAEIYLPFYFFILGFVFSEITVINGLKRFNIHINLIENLLIAFSVGVAIMIAGRYVLKGVYNRPYLTYREQLGLVEKAFSILVLCTACAMLYAHGANDIATAIGPVVSILRLVLKDFLNTNNHFLFLILTCGYVGVLIGFLTYGRKIIETVGSSITELTPSRAFCATLAAACTAVISINIGLPVSTTQTLVGGILGVGLARGIGSLDLRIVRNIFMSWFVTIPVTAILTTILFYGFKLFI